MAVRVGMSATGQPLKDAVISPKNFYHYYQVFVIAEVLDTGLRGFFDMEDPELLRSAFRGKWDELPRTRVFRSTRLKGRYALKEFPSHRASFDAIAWFGFYRQRLWNTAFPQS